MALKDDLEKHAADTFKASWATRKGVVVPAPEDLKLSNEAVHFARATILYADLSGSTAMVDNKAWQFAAEIYKTFLYCASRIINAEGGFITSYDGDRVMAVFVGDAQSRPAVRAALKINHAVKNIVNPALKRQYSTDYVIKQVVGIDTGEVRAARTGVRGDNDIVWVGSPANYAAKLTELNLTETSWITKAVYDVLSTSETQGANQAPIWKSYKWSQNGDKPIYGSAWTWSF